MKVIMKIVFLLVLAFATLLLFAADGGSAVKDLDREVFSGFSVSLTSSIWVGVLVSFFRRKKKSVPATV
jgi:hypothetical protein